MRTFIIYYVISTSYTIWNTFRYKGKLIKHPAVEYIGFDLVVILQFIFGFISAPILLFYQIKRIHAKWSSNKLRREFIIECSIFEEEIFTCYVHKESVSLKVYINIALLTIHQRPNEFPSQEQFIVHRNGEIGFLRDGDPDNHLQDGWEKIVTIRKII